jgi:hypothetical protein
MTVKWMRDDDGPGHREPDTAKTWRRKDGTLVRRPEPEQYMISLTHDQSHALKAMAKAEGVNAFELAARAVVEFIRSHRLDKGPDQDGEQQSGDV